MNVVDTKLGKAVLVHSQSNYGTNKNKSDDEINDMMEIVNDTNELIKFKI